MSSRLSSSKYSRIFIIFLLLKSANVSASDSGNLFSELPFYDVDDATDLRLALTGEDLKDDTPAKAEFEVFVEDILEDINAKVRYLLQRIVHIHAGQLSEDEEIGFIEFQKKELFGIKGIAPQVKNDIDLAKQGLIARLTDYKNALLEMKMDLEVTRVPVDSDVDLNTYRLFRCANSARQWLALYTQSIKPKKKGNAYDIFELDRFIIDLSQQLESKLPDYNLTFQESCKILAIIEGGRKRPANEYNTEIFEKLARKNKAIQKKLIHLKRKLRPEAYPKYQGRADFIIELVKSTLRAKNWVLKEAKDCDTTELMGDTLFLGFIDLSRAVHKIRLLMHSFDQDYEMVMQQARRQQLIQQREKDKEQKAAFNRLKAAERLERERRARETRALQKQLRKMWKECSEVELEMEDTPNYEPIPTKISAAEPVNSKKLRKEKIFLERLSATRAHKESLRAAKQKERKREKRMERWQQLYGSVGHLTMRKQQMLINFYYGYERFKPNDVVPFLKSLGGTIVPNNGSQRTVTFVGADGKLTKGIFHEHHGSNDEKGLRDTIREILSRAGFLPEKP